MPWAAHVSSLSFKAYTNPIVEHVEKLHAKNMKPTTCFLSSLLKYFMNTEILSNNVTNL